MRVRHSEFEVKGEGEWKKYIFKYVFKYAFKYLFKYIYSFTGAGLRQ